MLIVEGAKCAEAAKAISRNSVVVTWAGGTNAWDKTDWKPLAGGGVVAPTIARLCATSRRRECGCTSPCSNRVTVIRRDIADALEEHGEEGAKALFKQLCKNALQQRQGGSANGAQDEPGDAAVGDANQHDRTDEEKAREAESTARGPLPAPESAPEAAAQASAVAGEGDWQEELLEACENDSGAPFEEDALKALKKDNRLATAPGRAQSRQSRLESPTWTLA